MPAYNEEKRIGITLESYLNFFKEKKKNKELDDFEILVVINHSSDRTEEVVRGFQENNKELLFLNLERLGKGFAIIEGFKYALEHNFDLIGFVDADMATPAFAFFDLIKNIGNSAGIIASRWIKGSVIKTKQTFLRKITSRGFNFIVRVLFLMPYKDTQCGAKLFKKNVIEKIANELSITEWAFDVNLLYLCKKSRFRIKEHPTVWEDKKESKIDLGKVPIQMFSGILRLRLINSFFEPLLRPVKFILKTADKLINKR